MYLTHLINSPEARVAFARSEVMEDMLLALKSAKEKKYITFTFLISVSYNFAGAT